MNRDTKSNHHYPNPFESFLYDQLQQLENTGMLRSIPQIEGTGKYLLPAEDGGKPMLNLSSNDYLGLLNRPELVKEFLEQHCPGGTARFHFSSASSRLLTGNCTACDQLEALLCEMFGKEAALLFNSGYHANTGILPALAGKDSLIVADRLVHASLIDGIILSGRPFIRYRHNDYNHLEDIIRKEKEHYKHIFVVTESIFSMDGDTADLITLATLKKKYPQLILYLDEAHAFGTRGARGLGLAEESEENLNIFATFSKSSPENRLIGVFDIIVGTFGKAASSVGAFAVCSQVIKNYLVNKSRPLIFSTALPEINLLWSHFICQKLSIFVTEREHLKELSAFFRNELGKQNRNDYPASNSNILPYHIGDAAETIRIAVKLQQTGFYVLPIRPPTVPAGSCRIRFSLTSAMDKKDLLPIFSLLN